MKGHPGEHPNWGTPARSHPDTVGPPSPTKLNLFPFASTGVEWAQGSQWSGQQGHPTLHEMSAGYLLLLPLSRAGHEVEAGTALALQCGLWLLGGCSVLTPTAQCQLWVCREPPQLGKHGPGGKLPFGKSLKACVPQRASSPSAVTRWIWYSEFWSIWRWT